MEVKQSRRELEQEQRKGYILSRATELFSVHGYEDTTVAMIAEASEFSVGTVYNIFPSKSDIYSAIIVRELERVAKMNLELAQSEIPPKEKIFKLIEMNLRSFVEHHSFIKLFIDDLTHFEWGLPHNFGEKEKKMFRGIIEVDESIFSEAVEKGLLRKDIDVHNMMKVFRRIVNAFMMASIHTLEELDIGKVSNEILDVLLNGLGKRK